MNLITINKRIFEDKLLRGLIYREFQIINPQITIGFLKDAENKYRIDSMFHARVDALLEGIMMLLCECEDIDKVD